MFDFEMIFYFSFLDFVFVCIKCIFDHFILLFLYMIFFCKIMDDGRPYMWTHFIMEDEMAITLVPPLVEGSSSSMVVALRLIQLPIVK
jgi:hypothetical protein